MPATTDIEDLELKYEKSYVAFLDVLGFKQLVYSKKKADREKIELYLKTAHEALNKLKEIPSKKNISSILISDSIILTVPFGDNKTEHTNNLRQLCIAILSLQRKLSVKDIWVRGAVSYGDTYFDDRNNQIVGSAYIDAYLLEEKMAQYPRVILDNRIIKELNCHNSSCLINAINMHNKYGHTSYTKDVLYDWNKSSNLNVTLEKDTPLFINYLESDKAAVRHLIHLIEQKCQNIELYNKFKWVANYLMTVTSDQQIVNRLHEI